MWLVFADLIWIEWDRLIFNVMAVWYTRGKLLCAHRL